MEEDAEDIEIFEGVKPLNFSNSFKEQAVSNEALLAALLPSQRRGGGVWPFGRG